MANSSAAKATSSVKEVSLGKDSYGQGEDQLVDYDLLSEPIEDHHGFGLEDGSTSVQSGATTKNAAAGEESKDSPSKLSPEELTLLRSVFVKNVEFSATVDEVKQHFKECGEILRVTIGVNKATRKPLGYCYIEFADQEAAIRSKILNESLFKGRQITVIPKRKNVPHKGSGPASRSKQHPAMRGQNAMMA